MEEKKEYLNEEEFQKNARKLKKVAKTVLIIGIIMLILGVILTITGFLAFGGSAIGTIEDGGMNAARTAKEALGSMGVFTIGGFLDTSGLFVTAVGGILMLTAHRREISAFAAQQGMPVAQESIEKMAPSAGVAAKEIAKGIKEGFNEADQEDEQK